MHAIAPHIAARDLRTTRPWRRPRAWMVGLAAGLAGLVLFTTTAARGVEWQDSGVHQYRIITGQLENPVGLALSHPLHYWCGRAALHVPLGDPALRLNLMSALFGAVGVGVLGGLVVCLTRSTLAGALAAATLALTHSFWQMSALTETYTLAAALMIIEWTLLLRFVRTQRPLWLVAVFAVNGLHVADHLLGLLMLATYGVLLLERIARRRVAWGWLPVAIGAWIVTASPYWALVVVHFQRSGDLAGTLQSALFGGGEANRSWAREVLNVTLSARQLKLAILTFGYCFPSAAALVALVGVLRPARGRTRIFRRVLLAQTVIVFLFVGRYTIKDLYTFFVPLCALTALWFGLGVHVLWRRWSSRAARRALGVLLIVNALLPPVVYMCFPRIAEHRGWMRAQMRDIPYRNEYSHFLQPWRFLDHSPDTLARDILLQAGPAGWILADATTSPAIAVTCRVHGGPPDVRVFWHTRDMTYPGAPPLSPGELLRHVTNGGRVLAVPNPGVERLVVAPLRIEKTEPFWHVVLTPPHDPRDREW